MAGVAIVITVGVFVLIWRLMSHRLELSRDRNAEQRHQAQQRSQEAAKKKRQHDVKNRKSVELQQAILQIERDPDFRRAANKAAAAASIPADWRRRQFHRLRPLLVAHYQRCLTRGATNAVLLDSLTDLVEALGLEAFEADYIRQEAEQRRNRNRPTEEDAAPDFATELQRKQQVHEERLHAIDSMPNLNDDVREQLREEEQIRFQSELFERRRR